MENYVQRKVVPKCAGDTVSFQSDYDVTWVHGAITAPTIIGSRVWLWGVRLRCSGILKEQRKLQLQTVHLWCRRRHIVLIT